MAKAAHVIAVKVLGSNGSGAMSDVVGGVVWAAEQAKAKLEAAKAEFLATGKTSYKGAVANMSLGGGKSEALEDAVNRAVDSGMHFAVAAGKYLGGESTLGLTSFQETTAKMLVSIALLLLKRLYPLGLPA